MARLARDNGNMVSGTYTKTGFLFPFSNFPLSLVPETLEYHETVTPLMLQVLETKTIFFYKQ